MDLLDIFENVNQRYPGDLMHYYHVIMNAPNAYGQYHGPRHMFHVPWETYDGCVQMGLSGEDTRISVIAGGMHDYDHTCKRNDDQVNIDRAIAGLKEHILPEDEKYFEAIVRRIMATKFPYTEEKFTQNELILRDADQSQTFSPVWMESTLYRLGIELEMTHQQMLRIQRPFISKLQWATLWGKNKFGPLVEPRLKLIDRMVAALDKYEHSLLVAG